MSISPNYYLKAALEFEAKARFAADPKTKAEYQDLAQAHREVAKLALKAPPTSAAELDRIAANMLGRSLR
jgi:hypothetical protein